MTDPTDPGGWPDPERPGVPLRCEAAAVEAEIDGARLEGGDD